MIRVILDCLRPARARAARDPELGIQQETCDDDEIKKLREDVQTEQASLQKLQVLCQEAMEMVEELKEKRTQLEDELENVHHLHQQQSLTLERLQEERQQLQEAVQRREAELRAAANQLTELQGEVLRASVRVEKTRALHDSIQEILQVKEKLDELVTALMAEVKAGGASEETEDVELEKILKSSDSSSFTEITLSRLREEDHALRSTTSLSDSSDMEKDFEMIASTQETPRLFDFYQPNPFSDGGVFGDEADVTERLPADPFRGVDPFAGEDQEDTPIPLQTSAKGYGTFNAPASTSPEPIPDAAPGTVSDGQDSASSRGSTVFTSAEGDCGTCAGGEEEEEDGRSDPLQGIISGSYTEFPLSPCDPEPLAGTDDLEKALDRCDEALGSEEGYGFEGSTPFSDPSGDSDGAPPGPGDVYDYKYGDMFFFTVRLDPGSPELHNQSPICPGPSTRGDDSPSQSTCRQPAASLETSDPPELECGHPSSDESDEFNLLTSDQSGREEQRRDEVVEAHSDTSLSLEEEEERGSSGGGAAEELLCSSDTGPANGQTSDLMCFHNLTSSAEHVAEYFSHDTSRLDSGYHEFGNPSPFSPDPAEPGKADGQALKLDFHTPDPFSPESVDTVESDCVQQSQLFSSQLVYTDLIHLDETHTSYLSVFNEESKAPPGVSETGERLLGETRDHCRSYIREEPLAFGRISASLDDPSQGTRRLTFDTKLRSDSAEDDSLRPDSSVPDEEAQDQAELGDLEEIDYFCSELSKMVSSSSSDSVQQSVAEMLFGADPNTSSFYPWEFDSSQSDCPL